MNFKIIFAFWIILLLPFRIDSQIKILDYKGLEPYLSTNNDSTYVVNFWATWCKPCVQELHAFEQINHDFKGNKVKVLLVSLDFYKNYQTVLLPFLKTKDIKSEVVLLNDPNSNTWIDKIDKTWSGAIPATLIYNKSSRSFYERPFTFNQLDSVLNIKMQFRQ